MILTAARVVLFAALAHAGPSGVQKPDSTAVQSAINEILGGEDLYAAPQAGERHADWIDLGRKLFFDPRLSSDNTMSCATCHHPGLGWADGREKTPSRMGGMLKRNTPSILNTGSQPVFFWDGRSRSLEEQVLGPIENINEMGQNIEELVYKLNSFPGYVHDFFKVFGAPGITRETLAKSLSAFTASVRSPRNSPFDLHVTKRKEMRDDQQRGLILFAGKARCVKCHRGPDFTDNGFHNVGTPAEGTRDPGRYAVLPLPSMRNAFKTPGLRDAALTAPYGHAGNIPDLRGIVELYNRGGEKSENLSPDITPLNLEPSEINDLIAFLKALTSTHEPAKIPPMPAAAAYTSLQPIMGGALQRLYAIDETLKTEPAAAAVHLRVLVEHLSEVGHFPPEGSKEERRQFTFFLNNARASARKAAEAVERKSSDSPAKIEILRNSCNDCHRSFRPDGEYPFH